MIRILHSFRRKKTGQNVIKICQAEACQAMGARELTEHAKTRLGLDFHETDGDGRITLEPLYCMGYCAWAPVVVINNKVHSQVTGELFDELVDPLLVEK